MRNTKTRPDTKKTIGMAIAIGTGTSLILVLCLNMIGAMLITNGAVSESSMETLILVSQFLSALIGSILSGMLAMRKYAITTMLTIAIFGITLLGCGTIAFNSLLDVSIVNILGIVLAGVISCFICINLFEKKASKRKRIR